MTTPGTDHFSSPLSGRSFINPVTNISIISSFSASTHLPRLVKRTMPTDVLPAFLHEATHHWCFLTTVGGALTLLHQRALADAAKYDTSTPDRHKVRRLSSSMARFEAFMALQRPLAEGLALFAEFDLRSGGTLPSLCHVLARVADYFGPGLLAAEEPSDRQEETIRRSTEFVLAQMRRNRVTLERKTAVFVQPLDLRAGGYLPGYLLVKMLWSVAVGGDPRLNDAELFLVYVITYFYTDLGLIAHLLDDDADDESAVSALIDYFIERLFTFAGSQHTGKVDAVIAAHTNRPMFDDVEQWARAGSMNFDVDEELAAAGADRLIGLFEEVLPQYTGTIHSGDDAAIRNATLMTRRTMISLGHFPVSLKIDDRNNVTVSHQGTPLMEGRTSREELAGTTVDGSLEAYIHAIAGATAILVMHDEELIATWFSDDATPDWQRSVVAFRANLSRAQEEAQALLARLREAARSASTILFPLERARDRAIEATGQCAALGVGILVGMGGDLDSAATRVRGLLEAMRADGLANVLGRVRYVRALAWAGLFASTGGLVSPDEARRLFDEYRDFHGMDGSFDDAVALITRTAAENLGNPLFFVVNGRPLFAI